MWYGRVTHQTGSGGDQVEMSNGERRQREGDGGQRTGAAAGRQALDSEKINNQKQPAMIARGFPRAQSFDQADGALTEMAAPQPVSEDDEGDDLERHESIVKESLERRSLNNIKMGLTEVAAPQPVRESEERDNLENHETMLKKSSNRHSADNGTRGLTEAVDPSPNDSDAVEGSTPKAGLDGNFVSQSSTLEDEKGQRSTHAQNPGTFNEIATVAWLVFFSILGTLARMGVEAMATYPNAVVSSPVLWANLGGSWFLGLLLEDRQLFRYSAGSHRLTEDEEKTSRHIDESKKILPLYIGLAVGFCGSFTSFSRFITDAFLVLSNGSAPPDPKSPYHDVKPDLIQPRSGGYSFMALLAILILHLAVSVCAFKTGAHIAVGLQKVMPSLSGRFIHRVLDPVVIPVGLSCWLGAICLSIWPVASDWRRRATMALVFAPAGTLLRFYVSRTLNTRVVGFPLGTFVVNVVGTCVEGACYDLQHAHSIVGLVKSGRADSCAILEGVMEGFCGCTTTVSTWVAELNGLRRRDAWLYGIASVTIALGSQIAIMGSVAWTLGFDDSCGVRA